MEVIVIESNAWKGLIDEIVSRVVSKYNPDCLMTQAQVLEYTGFGSKWLATRKKIIGYIQDGKEIRFRKEHVDAYLNKHLIIVTK